MNKQIQQNGIDLAESLYGSIEAGIFQVYREGNRVAVFDNPEELKAYLRKRVGQGLQVRHLGTDPKRKLKGIYHADHFLINHK